jgi:hypothetical protein
MAQTDKQQALSACLFARGLDIQNQQKNGGNQHKQNAGHET